MFQTIRDIPFGRKLAADPAVLELSSKTRKTSRFLALIALLVCPAGAQNPPGTLTYANIRSIAFFDDRGAVVTAKFLAKDLAAIRHEGFNAIYLNYGWNAFESQINPPVFNTSAYAELKGVLDLLKKNGMKAFLGFNPNPPPRGIASRYTWLSEPGGYAAFVGWVEHTLEQIQSWNDADAVLVFVLTENALSYKEMAADPQSAAQIIRRTLGNIPTQITPSVRQAFQFGYHDSMLITLGLVTKVADSPIATPNPFDFFDMVAYPVLAGFAFPAPPGTFPDPNTYAAELALRASRFRSWYPSTPLMIGEMGYPSCGVMGGEPEQSAADSALISFALAKGYGFNLWAWRANLMDFSLNQPCGVLNYGLLRPDASEKPSYEAVRRLLNPSNSFPEVVLPTFPPEQYDAQFANWSVPSTMSPGSKNTIAITFANTGTRDWRMGSYDSGLLIRLGSRIPWDDSTWGVHRVGLAAGETIPPGASKTFSFPVTAPSAAGTYYIQWRMVREGVGWFGDASPVKIVNVARHRLGEPRRTRENLHP